MSTRKEIIQDIEKRCNELIGTRFKYTPLMGFPGYKSWKKEQLIEFKTRFLS